MLHYFSYIAYIIDFKYVTHNSIYIFHLSDFIYVILKYFTFMIHPDYIVKKQYTYKRIYCPNTKSSKRRERIIMRKYIKTLGITTIALTLLCTSLTGCGKDKTNGLIEVSTEGLITNDTEASTEASTEQTTDEATTESTTEGSNTESTLQADSSPSQNKSDYSSILDKYHQAISENWDFQKLSDNSLNYMCSYYSGTGLNDIGYAYYDINSDGVNELLIGLTAETHNVLDIYSLVNGTPTLIAQSGERDMYSICKNGYISETASNGAANSFYVYYKYDSGSTSLTLVEAVVIDAYINTENPYFYTTTSVDDLAAYTQSSESEGDTIMAKYTDANIVFTPFSQY